MLWLTFSGHTYFPTTHSNCFRRFRYRRKCIYSTAACYSSLFSSIWSWYPSNWILYDVVPVLHKQQWIRSIYRFAGAAEAIASSKWVKKYYPIAAGFKTSLYNLHSVLYLYSMHNQIWWISDNIFPSVILYFHNIVKHRAYIFCGWRGAVIMLYIWKYLWTAISQCAYSTIFSDFYPI